MVEVIVFGSMDEALKKFKKKVEDSSIFRQIRDREWLKKSERKKQKAARARRRRRDWEKRLARKHGFII